MDKPRLKFWQIWNMSSLSWGVLRRTPQTPRSLRASESRCVRPLLSEPRVLRRTPQTPPSLPGVNPARSGPCSPREIA